LRLQKTIKFKKQTTRYAYCEPDEIQQNIHMLMCSNEFEPEGLIAVTGKYLHSI
jgi:hypothetical protein